MSRLTTTFETVETRGERMEFVDCTIRVIHDSHDAKLLRNWNRMEEETDRSPYMYYEWSQPWWRLFQSTRPALSDS